jgi:2-dehydro-3-deoxyphosphogluconate aldolase / (4S)-4-hydroxy-2-oxoglutarate aldolase
VKPEGIVAIIRLRETTPPDELIEALASGGIRYAEVTVPTPDSLAAIERWRSAGSGVTIGAGTVRTEEDARSAIDAGAEFLVTPYVATGALRVAGEAGVPVLCGALSPTEVVSAYDAGAAVVKVFPAGPAGGAAYVRALQDPLPDIPLLPTGGVDIGSTRTYAELGCAGVGVGSQLVSEDLVSAGRWDDLRARAIAFAAAWADGR